MPHYTEAQKREILRQARANVAGHTSTASRSSTTPYTGTEEQKRAILQRARELVTGRRVSTTSRSSTTHRTDQSRHGLVHKTYEPPTDDDQTANGAAATRVSATEQPWWERVQEYVDYRVDVLRDAVGEALGTVTNKLCEQLEREDAVLKRENKLLRREFAVLREEVRVERGLRDLHEEVAEARKQMPKVPAIAERLRAEQNIARVDISTEQSKLRHDLSVLKARHSNLDANVFQFMRSMQNIQTNEIAYESASERMIIRPVHPDAARALREFAATVLDHDDVVH
jgi:hypothetical protein